jgi:hypothetical protein
VNIISQDRWDSMMWLLDQGETQREIARVVGVNRETVMLAARASGDTRSRSDAMRRYHQRRRESAP